MSSDNGGWAWFEPFSDGRPASDRRDLERAFARCFGGADGERALAHLRAVTLERALGPGTPPDTLRHLEGQRHLVTYIATLAARGRQGGA